MNKYAKKVISSFTESHPCPDNFIGVIEMKNHKIQGCLHFNSIQRKSFVDFLHEEEQIRQIVEKAHEIGNENLVIILESPHTSEYSECLQCPNYKCSIRSNFIAPALGSTGIMLQRYLINILQEKEYLSSNKKYNVILMNSIQYQCSKGRDVNLFRDINWCKLWFRGGMKDDFICRLKTYNPSIVINACTIGGHYKNSDYTGKKPNSKFLETLFKKIESLDENKYKKILESAKGKHCLGFSLRGYVQVAIDEAIPSGSCKKFYAVGHPSSWFNFRYRNILPIN